ncbi:MAG: methyltransferase domain-containing protein [Kiloniellales bacterium]|nr:methyltransferase domain-containing protein [Kiloniellales bacterium]
MSAADRPLNRPKTRDGKIPFGVKLKAWWEGYEVKVRHRDLEAEAEAERNAGPVRLSALPWDEARIALVQAVWGAGCSAPGGEAYLCELVKPFALTEHMSVVDVGAGLGEAVRVIAKNFHCRSKGFEPDPKLVAGAAELSQAAHMAGRAKVLPFDDPEFPPAPHSVDCVLSKEFLYLVDDKRGLLTALVEGLKRPGQLLFTDYVLASEDGPRSDVDAWAKVDPEPIHPWTVAHYEALFAELGLEHRISEDISDSVKARAVKGWEQFIGSQKRGGAGDHLAPLMVREIEIWTRRMAALQSGQLRAYRFFALKRNQGQKLSVT